MSIAFEYLCHNVEVKTSIFTDEYEQQCHAYLHGPSLWSNTVNFFQYCDFNVTFFERYRWHALYFYLHHGHLLPSLHSLFSLLSFLHRHCHCLHIHLLLSILPCLHHHHPHHFLLLFTSLTFYPHVLYLNLLLLAKAFWWKPTYLAWNFLKSSTWRKGKRKGQTLVKCPNEIETLVEGSNEIKPSQAIWRLEKPHCFFKRHIASNVGFDLKIQINCIIYSSQFMGSWCQTIQYRNP